MPPSEPHPSRSVQTEKLLTDRGFSWEYRIDVPLNQFDVEKSLRNQARIGQPLNKHTVERYVVALGNGDEFPAIVAAEPSVKKAGLLVVDGNHRYEAHQQMKRATIDAYIIKGASPAAITTLTFEANTHHGLPTDEKDRIHQALYLIDNGLSAEDAARRLGIKPSKLRQEASLAAADRRAVDAGLNRPKWDRLPASVRLRMNQLSTDEGFAALGKLVLDANLKTEDVAKAVSDMAQLRSSRKQVDYVQTLRLTFAQDLQTGGRPKGPIGRQPRSGRLVYGMALGQLKSLPSATDIVTMMTDDDKPEWLARTDAAIKTLTEIREALKK